VRKQLPAAFVMTILFALGACQRQTAAAPASEDPRIPVALQPVKVQPWPRTLEVVGTLRGDAQSTIAAKVAGRVERVAVDVGDTVASGAMLAKVETADYELALAQREAALKASLAELGLTELPDATFDVEKVPAVVKASIEAANAEARFQRAAAMFAEKPPLVTEQEHADAAAAAAAARASHDVAVIDARSRAAMCGVRAAELALGKKALADAAIDAPAGGPWRVGRRHVDVGDWVHDGTALFDLVDTDPIRFRADVPERWSAEVKIGLRAQVEVPSAKAPVAGVVRRIAPVVDVRKRTFVVEIAIDNAQGLLMPGGFAQGRIELRVDPAVVFVPQDAVVAALGASKVFTVKDGKAVEHKVAVGVHDGSFVELAQGDVGPGDQVVVSGAARLATGVPVAVVPAPAGGGGK
jgi:RND family efflux transporter MFP subunit